MTKSRQVRGVSYCTCRFRFFFVRWLLLLPGCPACGRAVLTVVCMPSASGSRHSRSSPVKAGGGSVSFSMPPSQGKGVVVSDEKGAFFRLRRLNLVAGLLHAVSASVVVVLSNGFSLPVSARYMTGQPGSGLSETVVLGSLPTAIVVALFFYLSAAAHLAVAGPLRALYERWLSAGWNPARWVEYSCSSSAMLVVICQLSGIDDVTALVAVVGANVAMILFGFLQEKYECPGGSLVPFWFGCVAGVSPWVAIFWNLFSPGSSSAASAPGFVYGIVFSLFVFFNCFAVVQFLQYRARGRWVDYLFGERVYVVLSLAAKSALAWQVFAGTLAA